MTNKTAAWDALNAETQAADAQYDFDLGAIDRSDRAGVRAATAKYEAALAVARSKYNEVMWPGVFAKFD